MSNRQWVYTERGRLSATIKQTTAPMPDAKEGEVVIKVKAAALNPVENQIAQSPDALLRLIGAPPHGTPFVPCWDFSGTIHRTGAGVTDYILGDEVFGVLFNMTGNGSLQDYVAIPASYPFIRKAPTLSWTDAAALPLVYGTVYTALINYGRLPFDRAAGSADRSVLILGGSSGTGSVGIQLAKKMGLRVVTTCSGKNIDFVKSLGADEVIDYTTDDVTTRALHSQYAPYAVVLDCVGGTDLLPHMDHLILDDAEAQELGIYVTIVGDSEFNMRSRLMIETSRDAMGGATTNYYYPSQAIRQWRGRLNDYLPRWLPGRTWITNRRYECIMFQPTKEMYETIPRFLESAKEVKVDSVWRFDDAPKAFARIETSRAKGKVVVEF